MVGAGKVSLRPQPPGVALPRGAPAPQGPRSSETVGLAVQRLMPSVPEAGYRDNPQSPGGIGCQTSGNSLWVTLTAGVSLEAPGRKDPMQCTE